MTQNAQTVTVLGTFQPSDYWRANRYLQNRMARVWFVRIFLLVMPWVVVFFQYKKDPASWTWWLLAIPVVFVILVLIVLPLIDRAFLERRMRSIPSAFGPQSYAFSDNGVEIVGESKNLDLKWSGIVRATESSQDFFLFVGANIAQFVPKRFLLETGQEVGLREVLKRNLGGRAKLQ